MSGTVAEEGAVVAAIVVVVEEVTLAVVAVAVDIEAKAVRRGWRYSGMKHKYQEGMRHL